MSPGLVMEPSSGQYMHTHMTHRGASTNGRSEAPNAQTRAGGRWLFKGKAREPPLLSRGQALGRLGHGMGPHLLPPQALPWS